MSIIRQLVFLVVVLTLVSTTVSINVRELQKTLTSTGVKVYEEPSEEDLMKLTFGIIGKKWDDTAAKGHMIGTVLVYTFKAEEKVRRVPFIWAVNSIKDGVDAHWKHGERLAIDEVKKFCATHGLTPKDVWKDMEVYTTLQPCWKCSVEIMTFFNNPPTGVYFGARDLHPNADVAFIYTDQCGTNKDAGCKMMVSKANVTRYEADEKQGIPRCTEYNALRLQSKDLDGSKECKAMFLMPSTAGLDLPDGLESGLIAKYLPAKTDKPEKQVQVAKAKAVFKAWGASSKAKTLLDQVSDSHDVRAGIFTLGTRAIKKHIEKCLTCHKNNKDSTTKHIRFCFESIDNPCHAGETSEKAEEKIKTINCASTWKTIASADNCFE